MLKSTDAILNSNYTSTRAHVMEDYKVSCWPGGERDWSRTELNLVDL